MAKVYNFNRTSIGKRRLHNWQPSKAAANSVALVTAPVIVPCLSIAPQQMLGLVLVTTPATCMQLKAVQEFDFS